MNNPHESLLIPADHPKESSKGRLYSKRQSKRNFRHQQVISLDAPTTEALTKAQHLDDLKTGDMVFSRTTLLRRAVLVYAQRLIQSAAAGNDLFISAEQSALLAMSARPKKKSLKPWG